MKKLVEALIAKQMTIGTCESLTGGLFAAALTAVPGVSKTLKGGFVTYWNESKIDVVHVPASTIERCGVVSAQTAKAMASHSRLLLDVDCCVSFTGNAGPDVLEGKAAGLVYTAVAFADRIFVYELQLDGSRNEVRQKVCEIMGEVVRFFVEKVAATPADELDFLKELAKKYKITINNWDFSD